MTTKSAQTEKEELKAALHLLKGYEVPKSLRSKSVEDDSIDDSNDNNNSSSSTDHNKDGDGSRDTAEDATATTTLDPAFIQRYKDARDLYLRRQIEARFLQHLETYNGETIKRPELPTEEEEQALEETLANARSSLNEAAQGFHQKILELQQKHSTFLMRRDELQKIVQDMEEENHNDDDVEGDDGVALKDNNEDVDEDQLAEEEERLSMLQQKKAQLQVELNRVREETSHLKTKAETCEAQVAELLQESDIRSNTTHNNDHNMNGDGQPSSPTALQAEAEETLTKLEKLKEIQSFYDNLRSLMEELTSIQVLSVTQVPTAAATITTTTSEESESSYNTDKDSQDSQERPGIRIHARVLDHHEIEIISKSVPDKPDELRVKSAQLLTPTVVTAPVDEYEEAANHQNGRDDSNGDENNDSLQQQKVLKLTIAPLDDLVRLCAMFPPGEEMRFLMREAMARIRITEARVKELALLYDNVLTKIGPLHQPGDSFGSPEQEVVCSLNEGISIVLRLTADCPVVPGSVYIYNMVGIAGWDDEAVQKIKERVSSKEFQSPWALIQEVQTEMSSFALPKTPTLPLRRKFEMEL